MRPGVVFGLSVPFIPAHAIDWELLYFLLLYYYFCLYFHFFAALGCRLKSANLSLLSQSAFTKTPLHSALGFAECFSFSCHMTCSIVKISWGPAVDFVSLLTLLADLVFSVDFLRSWQVNACVSLSLHCQPTFSWVWISWGPDWELCVPLSLVSWPALECGYPEVLTGDCVSLPDQLLLLLLHPLPQLVQLKLNKI